VEVEVIPRAMDRRGDTEKATITIGLDQRVVVVVMFLSFAVASITDRASKIAAR
jgi:hypothetical protein